MKIHVDRFTGSLAKLPPKRRTIVDALQALDRHPVVSTFERGAPWLEKLIRDMLKRRLIEERGSSYPYHRYAITEAGRGILALDEPQEGGRK